MKKLIIGLVILVVLVVAVLLILPQYVGRGGMMPSKMFCSSDEDCLQYRIEEPPMVAYYCYNDATNWREEDTQGTARVTVYEPICDMSVDVPPYAGACECYLSI